MEFDQDDARQIARETFAEARDAVGEGLRVAVPAVLKAATLGVVAYLVAKATQRTIHAAKWVALTAISVHFIGAAAGTAGHALMRTALVHVGAATVLGALSGWDKELLARLAVGGAGAAAAVAYYGPLTATGGRVVVFAIGGGFAALIWAFDLLAYFEER